MCNHSGLETLQEYFAVNSFSLRGKTKDLSRNSGREKLIPSIERVSTPCSKIISRSLFFPDGFRSRIQIHPSRFCSLKNQTLSHVLQVSSRTDRFCLARIFSACLPVFCRESKVKVKQILNG